MSEPNCCFSLIYKVFMVAFNLYNPEYLSLLYNIYFTFLLRGVFKISLRGNFLRLKNKKL